jgi:hypothetical protein
MKTKKVVSISDKPNNPAIRLTIDDGVKPQEQWLWSRFPAYSHEHNKSGFDNRLPVTYSHFDLAGPPKKYIVLAAPPADPWILWNEQEKIEAQKLNIGKTYSWDQDFHFTVEAIHAQSVIKKQWKNKTEALLKPALVLLLEYDQTKEEIVLELGEPNHIKTNFGTIVMMFRNPPAKPSPVAEG